MSLEDLQPLKDENARLKTENSKLESDVTELKEHRQELRDLIEFYKTQPKSEVAPSGHGFETIALKAELATEREKASMALGEVVELKEKLRRAEIETNRLKYEKMSAQGEADVFKVERDNARAELEASRRRIEDLEASLERNGSRDGIQMQAMTGVQVRRDVGSNRPTSYLSSLQGSQVTSSPEPTPSPAGPFDFELEYVSGSHGAGFETRASRSLNPRSSGTQRSMSSSSAIRVQSMVASRTRSPSLEILDGPPSGSQPARRGTKTRVRKDNVKTMQPFHVGTLFLTYPLVRLTRISGNPGFQS